MPEQLYRDDLAKMTADEIVGAHKEGRLDHYMSGGKPPEAADSGGDLTIEDLRRLAPGTLRRLDREGKIDDVLEGRTLAEAGLVQPAGDPDFGARPGPPIPRQLQEIDLAGMAPGEISRAYDEGRCDELLGRR